MSRPTPSPFRPAPASSSSSSATSTSSSSSSSTTPPPSSSSSSPRKENVKATSLPVVVGSSRPEIVGGEATKLSRAAPPAPRLIVGPARERGGEGSGLSLDVEDDGGRVDRVLPVRRGVAARTQLSIAIGPSDVGIAFVPMDEAGVAAEETVEPKLRTLEMTAMEEEVVPKLAPAPVLMRRAKSAKTTPKTPKSVGRAVPPRAASTHESRMAVLAAHQAKKKQRQKTQKERVRSRVEQARAKVKQRKESRSRRRVPSSEVSEVTERLFIGSQASAADASRLAKLGVTHILNMAKELEDLHEGQFIYLRGDLLDHPFEDLYEFLPAAVRFIDEGTQPRNGCLVHCAAGISRSPAAVIAFLMYSRRWRADEAVAFVNSKRACVDPYNFMHQLREFEQYLAERGHYQAGSPAAQLPDKLKERAVPAVSPEFSAPARKTARLDKAAKRAEPPADAEQVGTPAKSCCTIM